MGKKEKKAAKKAEKKSEKKLAKQAKAKVAVSDSGEKEPAAPKKAAVYTPVAGEKLKTISVKMPGSLVEAADAAARAYGEAGVSRSEYIRLAIEKMLNE